MDIDALFANKHDKDFDISPFSNVDDVARISSFVAANFGITLTNIQVCEFWRWYSDSFWCAGWIHIAGDEMIREGWNEFVKGFDNGQICNEGLKNLSDILNAPHPSNCIFENLHIPTIRGCVICGIEIHDDMAFIDIRKANGDTQTIRYDFDTCEIMDGFDGDDYTEFYQLIVHLVGFYDGRESYLLRG
jgi:hypothetical protein